MNHLLSFFISVLFQSVLTNSAQVPSNDQCLKFRTGTFHTILKNGSEIQIERSEQYQVERMDEKVIKLKINWLSNCEYELTLIETNDTNKKDLIGKVLHVKIIKVSGNSYNYTAEMNGSEGVAEGIVTKIK